jgi:Zn-dependent peptidase ImmA (M78 family)
MNYIYTPIEDYVKKLYQHLSINVPEEIDMIEIATQMDITLYFESISSKAIQKGKEYFIFINECISTQEQWQDFGHELCHILMHSGNQLHLPGEFILYQENKARNFARHFCIPTFMLDQLQLPPHENEAIEFIAKTFNVELDFAEVRLKDWTRQQQSFDYYEKIAESGTFYEVEEDTNNVVNLRSDVDDIPAPPEMIDEVFKELKIEGFHCSSPITIGILNHLREEIFNFENRQKLVTNK